MKRMVRIAGVLLPPLVVFCIVIAAWHYFVLRNDLKAYEVPYPAAVANAAWHNRTALGSAAWLTALAALSGFLFSLVAGVLAAFFLAQSKLIQRAFFPYAIFLQTVPIIALAPLIIKYSGYEFRSIVIASFIISLFPILSNTTIGLTSLDKNMEELFQVNGASRLQRLLKLQLPSAVPYIVAGAKISSGLSVIGAIIGEYFAGFGAQKFGLGYLIFQTNVNLKMDYMFAATIASTLLGLAIFWTVSVVGDALTKHWR